MDFSWITRRGAGVFLHISSLPSDYGIGNIGRSADAFLNFAKESGFSYWQICPLGPTGYGDSP
ncbi:MAG: 4-alpha-glucanotransferase, partial [Opitutales bacterium]|nr:4-alpha-glucanotransferase [Opitutales bacterium]